MNFSPATAVAEITVQIFSDIARTDLIASIGVADTIEFTETHNSPGPVPDVFEATIPVIHQVFQHDGQQYTAQVSLFHPPGDLESIQTTFISPEEGQSEGLIALKITSEVIPEPTSYFLLGSILGLFTAIMRRVR
jgi:hypothetical protein